MSYKSPIEVIYKDMEAKLEEDVYRAVLSYGIRVDREELIKALKHHKVQYDKGYADGKAEERKGVVCAEMNGSIPIYRCECGRVVFLGKSLLP